MPRNTLRGAMMVFAISIVTPAAAEPDRTPPPASAYFAPPAISEPVLSPDGAHIAARALVGAVPRLAIFDAGKGLADPRAVPLPSEERLEWYRWLDGGNLLVSLLRQGARPMSRLATVDLATGTLRQLGAPRPAGEGDEVLHVDRAGTFLLLETRADTRAAPSVLRIDLRTGAASLAVAARAGVLDWVADSTGVVRAGISEGGLVYRKAEGDRFSRAPRERRPIDQVVPVRGSDIGYAMAAAPSGRMALYAYDFRHAKLGRLLYENARVDLDGFETGPDGRLLGVQYSNARDETLWFDPAMAREQAAIDAMLPGRVNTVVSASADKSRLLVLGRSAGEPGAFYLVAGGHARLFAQISPMLSASPAPEVRAISYKARDGLEIQGFLTLPAGRAAKGLPLIVLPHGGPFARDSWGYDPWVRFLADRGYAVLQPNYRGSAGFGNAFLAKGDGQWGRGMQDDLDDGVAWLARQGMADAGRVCIMGASYGGYAAMWAAARDSGVYRCAISFAGISDVQAQLDFDHRTFEERDYRAWKHRIQGNAPSLDSLSPLRRAGDIAMPLLIAHGDADEVVPPEQSTLPHEALVRLGRAHEYVVYAGEGHNLDDLADSADFLARVGAFLDRHNPR